MQSDVLRPDFIVDDIQLFLQHHCQRLRISVHVTTPTAGRQQVRRGVMEDCSAIHFHLIAVLLCTTQTSSMQPHDN